MRNRIRLESGHEPIPGIKLHTLRGRGGFAEVWEAIDISGKRIGLKFMRAENSGSTVKEVKSLQAIQKLRHPNILQMHQVTCISGFIVVTMELAEGSLFDLFDAFQSEYHTPITPDLLCFYLRQAAAALDFLNTRQHLHEGRTVGFQHCDIKPSNLLLCGETIKLADFGLCNPTTTGWTPIERSGTLDFAPPETHRGMLCERSDQFSLAVTYYYLRTGMFPFPATDEFKRKYSYNRPSPELSLVPRPERKTLERALATDPEHRWPSCGRFMEVLTESINHPADEIWAVETVGTNNSSPMCLTGKIVSPDGSTAVKSTACNPSKSAYGTTTGLVSSSNGSQPVISLGKTVSLDD